MGYTNRISVYKQEDIIDNTLCNYLKSVIERQQDIESSKIADVFTFIYKNVFQRDISVSEINIKFNLGTSDVVSFREVAQMGIAKYVQKLKMEATKKLLQQKDLEINVIAFKLFYNHEQSFSRAFKNYFGMSPTEYRDSH